MGTTEDDSRVRIESCLRLAELSARLFEGRRQYEWKVTLGFWALIVAAIKYLEGKRLPLCVYLVVPVVFGFVWLRGVYVAHENDKRTMYFYREASHELLLNPSYVVHKPEVMIRPLTPEWWIGFLFSWATFFEFATSVLLIWIAYRFIG